MNLKKMKLINKTEVADDGQRAIVSSSSAPPANLPPAARGLLQTYPKYCDFATTYSPAADLSIAMSHDAVFTTEKAPTLGTVRRAYGDGAAAKWLEARISALAEYAGVADDRKLTDSQKIELSYILLDKIGHLKVSEIALFFHKIKRGDFGRFYGTVDPITISGWAGEYLEWRADQLDRIERRRVVEEAAAHHDACNESLVARRLGLID